MTRIGDLTEIRRDDAEQAQREEFVTAPVLESDEDFAVQSLASVDAWKVDPVGSGWPGCHPR